MRKVTDWPGNFIGLSGTHTDRPAKVTDYTVIFSKIGGTWVRGAVR